MFGWLKRIFRRTPPRPVHIVQNRDKPEQTIAVIGSDHRAMAEVAARAFFTRGAVRGELDENGNLKITELKTGEIKCGINHKPKCQ